MTNIPAAGDIVWVDLNPVRGTEQGGVRPALIISSTNVHAFTMRSIICPITSNLDDWPTKVVLPHGMQTKGAVLADQLRSVDRSERGIRFIEKAPADLLANVREIIGALLEIKSTA
jgi:mRNA interferase MazF